MYKNGKKTFLFSTILAGALAFSPLGQAFSNEEKKAAEAPKPVPVFENGEIYLSAAPRDSEQKRYDIDGALAFLDDLSRGEMSASFEVASAVADEDLAEMRGGMITADGLKIDFSLTTQMLVNNVLQHQFQVTSDTANEIDPKDLITVIQLGQNNISLPVEQIKDLPGAISIIQNTLDDQLIQQFNILDVTVNGQNNFKQQVRTPLMNFMNVNSLQ